METGEHLRDLIIEFDLRTKFFHRGKHIVYHLSHDTKIKHMEVVDPRKIICLSNDDVIFHRSNE